MNRYIRYVIGGILVMHLRACDAGPNQSILQEEAEESGESTNATMFNISEEDRWRLIFNSYIITRTSFSAIGMHDIIERRGLDFKKKDEKSGITPLQLAQQEGNEIAVHYLLSRGAVDDDPHRSQELLKRIEGKIKKVNHVVFRSENGSVPIVVDCNTMQVTTAAASIDPQQSAQQPAIASPEISGYTGQKKLKKSPKDDDDDE